VYSENTKVIGRVGDILPHVEKLLLVFNHILQLEKNVFERTVIDLMK
jgi:hypothetical protein